MTEEDIHTWFGLSYAQYLTIPRTVLQSMPMEWQERFVGCLREIGGAWVPDGKTYWCTLRDDETGRFEKDSLADYQRGRRMVRF